MQKPRELNYVIRCKSPSTLTYPTKKLSTSPIIHKHSIYYPIDILT